MISKNIVKLRKRDHISQEELAEKIGVTRQTIAKWENGESVPDLFYSNAMAEVFDVTLDDFNAMNIKQRIGFVSSGMEYYPRKKLKLITKITSSFYKDWQEETYQKYMKMFGLEEQKTPSELSNGMKIKYALTLALSHNADLLILDEPTSGLDPVSREDLLEIFMQLSEEGKTILFSTHITSDLEKCADEIIYMKDGKILSSGERKQFVEAWRVVEFGNEQLSKEQMKKLIGLRRSKEGFTALIPVEEKGIPTEYLHSADLESIMVHLEKEDAS